MVTVMIAPVGHPLATSVCVPGSKILANRALAIAVLAEEATMLMTVLVGDDVAMRRGGPVLWP